MALSQKPQEFADPFARAIPGQSLTDTPGSRPYEKPPSISSPEEFLDIMEPTLKGEASQQIADILDVGVSCETVAHGICMKSFTEGMISPDVAELAKPGIFMIVAQIGDDHEVEDMTLFNGSEDEAKPMNPEQKLAMMQKMAPHKYQKLEESGRQDEMELEGMMEQEYAEEEMPPEQGGSFMDISVPEQSGEESYEEFEEMEEM